MNYQRFQIVRSGITRSMGGFVVPVVVGAPKRGIVFNGSNQDARVDLPNAAPWNSMGAFKVILRMRGLSTGSDRRTMEWLGPTYDMSLHSASGGTRIDFADGRDGIQIFHTPTDLTDMVIKLQFDPSNTRWTMETWKGDGTGYVSGTVALTTTTNLNLSDILYICSNSGALAYANGHVDWWGIQSGADAMGSGNFPGAEPPAGTYYALWKFDSDDGTDSSGNGLTLTLTNSPSFENTP